MKLALPEVVFLVFYRQPAPLLQNSLRIGRQSRAEDYGISLCNMRPIGDAGPRSHLEYGLLRIGGYRAPASDCLSGCDGGRLLTGG